MSGTVVELPRVKCPRCGYSWVPRVPNPRRCPRCQALQEKSEVVRGAEKE